MNVDPAVLEELLQQVKHNEKYAAIDEELVRKVGHAELQKRGSLKEAVKSTRNKLHQIGVSYQEKPIPYDTLRAELATLPVNLSSAAAQQQFEKWMLLHASTQERLTIHQTFFKELFALLGSIDSVLDLACGLNPLNLPWMPLQSDVQYYACDIYSDMMAFLGQFFTHFKINGQTSVTDLTQTIPQQPVKLAMLLKTIPCLDQIDKSAAERLLEGLAAEYLLVTFPAHSLGGQSKGMIQNYTQRFEQLTAGKPWQVERFLYPGELAFLVRK
jgi:16S rRNA (guanine(1405)-N(7))-methyltransferase